MEDALPRLPNSKLDRSALLALAKDTAPDNVSPMHGGLLTGHYPAAQVPRTWRSI